MKRLALITLRALFAFLESPAAIGLLLLMIVREEELHCRFGDFHKGE